jgi:hypothetical protein
MKEIVARRSLSLPLTLQERGVRKDGRDPVPDCHRRFAFRDAGYSDHLRFEKPPESTRPPLSRVRERVAGAIFAVAACENRAGRVRAGGGPRPTVAGRHVSHETAGSESSIPLPIGRGRPRLLSRSGEGPYPARSARDYGNRVLGLDSLIGFPFLKGKRLGVRSLGVEEASWAS